MKFAGGRIQAQRDVLAGPESGLSDRRHQEVQRFLGRAQIGREAALVAHVDRMAGAFQGVLSAWNTSAPMRTASAKLAAPTGSTMNSWKSSELSAWAPPLAR